MKRTLIKKILVAYLRNNLRVYPVFISLCWLPCLLSLRKNYKRFILLKLWVLWFIIKKFFIKKTKNSDFCYLLYNAPPLTVLNSFSLVEGYIFFFMGIKIAELIVLPCSTPLIGTYHI